MPRKPLDRKAQQQLILTAARQVFVEKGIESTSMDDIAVAAKYTRRTLYAYFKSRDDVCLALFVDDQTERWQRQKEAVAHESTGLSKLLVWAEVLYEFSKERPHTLSLQLYWDLHGIKRDTISNDIFAAFEEINNQLADGLREIFRLGVGDRTMRPDLEIDMTISQFLYAYRAVLNRALSSDYSFARFDPDQYVASFVELFTRGIRHDKESHT